MNSWFRYFCISIYKFKYKIQIQIQRWEEGAHQQLVPLLLCTTQPRHQVVMIYIFDHDDEEETEDANDEDLVCTFVPGTEASQETS